MKNEEYSVKDWNRRVDLAIELACLRGDIKSIEGNPVAKKALINALDPNTII